MIEVKHSAGRQIQGIAAGRVVKRLHRRLDLFLHRAAFLLRIKRTVLKDDVLALRHVHQLHLRRNLPLPVQWKPRAEGLRLRDAPAADPSCRLIDVRDDLAASAAHAALAQIVELSPDAGKQRADRLAVLPGNPVLFLPEIPESDALVVADMQEFVRGNRHKIRLHIFRVFHHAVFSLSNQIAVKRAKACAQRDGRRMPAVGARRHAVGLPERARKCLVGGKPVVKRDLQQAALRIADLLKREGQPAVAQIIPKLHAGNLPEPSGDIERRIPQTAGKRVKRRLLILMRPDARVDLVDHPLHLIMPCAHRSSLRRFPL